MSESHFLRRIVEAERESARKAKKARETTRRRNKKIGLALIASVYAIGQGQEDKDQRKRTIV